MLLFSCCNKTRRIEAYGTIHMTDKVKWDTCNNTVSVKVITGQELHKIARMNVTQEQYAARLQNYESHQDVRLSLTLLKAEIAQRIKGKIYSSFGSNLRIPLSYTIFINSDGTVFGITLRIKKDIREMLNDEDIIVIDSIAKSKSFPPPSTCNIPNAVIWQRIENFD